MNELPKLNDSPGMDEESFWATNNGDDGYVLREEPNNEGRPFDLEERTAKFGEPIIAFAKKVPENSVNNRLVSQLVGAGTSVGANYCEASDCVSKRILRNPLAPAEKNPRKHGFFYA